MEGQSAELRALFEEAAAQVAPRAQAKEAKPKTKWVLRLGGDGEADLALFNLRLPATMPSTPSGRVESLPFCGARVGKL
jgi:hypothetical protein